MKVFLTGATGFVGSEVLRQLIAAGHQVRALVRAGSEDKLSEREQVEIHHGDVTDRASLDGALEGCEAVIHLVGIIREFPGRDVTFQRLHVEGTEHILAAAKAQGVRRYLHMSSNGARVDGVSDYHKTKGQAEEAVRASSLDWSIFRPSLIFGPGGEFVSILEELIRRIPIVPVLGDGAYRMQPVALEQVAQSFVQALSRPETIGQSYHLGGSESYSYDELLDLTGKAMGRESVGKLHQPLFMLKPMIKLMQHHERFPISFDQLTMLVEGNVCDPKEWAEAFELAPISYAEGIGRCISSE
ncbi:MAG: complex I NDUFA9 subunit family protein [Desulfuromonadales bacterium]|nr:complex I NDUFA9 subunit family protein [Desulfuromonadales bacterium]